jgi:excinuclease ABC subunit B
VREEMLAEAAELNFERAAELRDQLLKLEKQELGLSS